MDTVTQMLLGAVVGQAGFRRRLGRRALVAGAAVALVPDLDVVAGWIGGPVATWLYHRGITHSILFGIVAGLLFGWLLWRWQRWRDGPAADGTLGPWIALSVLALETHWMIDVPTTYGTQIFAPFSDVRVAFDAMPIIDPLYSLVLAAALVVGGRRTTGTGRAAGAAWAALGFITLYTLYGWHLNRSVEARAEAELAAVGWADARVDAYPTLFQPFYRRVVAQGPQGVRIGFTSTLAPAPIRWRDLPESRDPRVATVAATEVARVFAWFTLDNLYWSVEEDGDRAAVTAYDLRYGLPGSELGFWGIRAIVDAGGGLVEGPVPIDLPRRADGESLAAFWAGILGGPP